MSDAAARLVIVAAGAESAARHLARAHRPVILPDAELSPDRPFQGALFELLGGHSPGDVVVLAVPAVVCTSLVGRAAVADGPATRTLLAVRDHVNLALRGPLTGRWPAGEPRSFPCMTGIYQPAVVRALGGASVYSDDVVVAGVADAGRLTPFERAALDEVEAAAFSDRLVPAVVLAAFHGLKVAACVVPQAARERE